MTEPHYAPENPFEDEYNPRVKPKWVKPKTYSERLILNAVGRQGYKSEAEARQVKRIVVNISDDNSGDYPIAWIKHCCEWAKSKREKGKMVQLKGLLTLIQNTESKREYMEKQVESKKYKDKF